ncbi:7808_t:CDS:2 [Entrophospora sp. SA101]|nr:7808_t:CDS:2 [Entrophospora sp. SA101]
MNLGQFISCSSPPHQSNTTLNLPHNVLANLDHSTLSSHSPHLLTINLNNNYNDNYDNSIQYSPMPSSSYHQHHHIDSLVNTLHPHHQYSSSGSTPQQPFNLQSIQKVNSSSPFIAANTVQPNPKGLKSQKDSNAVEDAARTLFLSSRLNSDFNFKDNNNNKFLITPTSSFQYDHPLQHYTDEETIEKQGEIGLIPHNRGHKLKNRAYTIGEKSRLQAPYDIYQDIEYIDTPNNQRCPIIHKFSRNSILKAVECFNDLEFDPYKDINVREIFYPLEKLEDVVRKPHYKRILNDSSLTHCADFLMERIDNEKNFNNVISRLMTVLQGDDTMYPNLDFKLNPPSEIISTRVVKVEEEGGVDLGVLGVGLQGNDRNRDIRVHEAKDQGLETLIAVREQLQEQISNSNEILRCLIESRNDYTDEETIEKQGEIGLIPHNRGHKLKNRAYTIGEKSRLQAPYDIYQDIEYIDTPNNQRCPIIHKFSRNSILKAVECFNDLEFDPYKDINVREIFYPLEKLEDVVRKPHYKRILNDSSLTHCADFLMERIDNEKNFNNVISRLMTVLQGDDTMYPNLDFKLNPPSEIISTRVVKVEEEGGVDLGVLGVGLQGNDRNRDIRVHEAKDQGLETLIAVREQLQEQISNSNEILRCLIESRNGVLKAIRQRDLLKVKIVSIDKHKKKLEKKELKRNYQETLE